MALRDWLVDHPPPDGSFTQTVAGVARRVARGESFHAAVRELLDEYALLTTDEQRRRALAETPGACGDPRHDAYLGALAEHLATGAGFVPPSWTADPLRFLDRFWFVSDVRGFRALALAESPAAFRRRGIFVSLGSLARC